MAIDTSRSEVSPQPGGRKFVAHVYTFSSSGVSDFRLDRGKQPDNFDVAADRTACEPKALDYEENCLIWERVQPGLWSPDNPTPFWDKEYKKKAVGRFIVRDACRIADRFQGVTPFDGQVTQLALVWEDPEVTALTPAQAADFLGITTAEVKDIDDYYQVVADLTNRGKYQTLQDRAIIISQIEFTKE